MQKFILITLAAFTLAGCVSTKKFDAMRAQAMKAERELELVNALAADLEAKRDEILEKLGVKKPEKAEAPAAPSLSKGTLLLGDLIKRLQLRRNRGLFGFIRSAAVAWRGRSGPGVFGAGP